ncbi:hypothetical protein ROJ8625_00516 [Roseivivax jejudonensis]|uniref:DUF1127 domain-containing protein n=1 Tax=Roseivivax jejudonensis TaxID=1529041 RepID=A0A1X6YBA4_9RHOB|nr:hypothetical protein [Roseivivax jejudonensis]SLN15794.1 hypothetical protein ROJ8625_00516 [Roseivivax jejudonensis]
MAQSAPADFSTADSLVSRLSQGLSRGLTFLIENNPRYGKIAAVNRMTDDELAARGTSRADMVRRAFQDQFYL